MRSETMLHVLCLFLMIVFVAGQNQTHHKVRHKHNLLNIRGNQMNEIREAFDQYRNVLRKNQNDVYDEQHDESINSRNDLNFERRNIQKTPASDNFPRNKRVFTTTKTTTRRPMTPKIIQEYDYEDDDNDTANRHLNEARVSSSRFNRDNADNRNHFDEEESLTDYKMKSLATMDDVRSTFQREMINNGQDVSHHIRQNILRTRQDGMCRWPNKKVIEMPQHATKIYTPRKYVIYKCSDETACCGSSDKTCVAKQSKDLTLWFHVRLVGNTTGVEPLKISNDTECECIYKDRVGMQRTTRAPYTIITTTNAPLCKCPSYFSPEIEDGYCGCVCEDTNSENMCRARYEGIARFTMIDQRCILTNECVQPDCLHGIYSKNNGRCPDRNDKINKGFQRTRRARGTR